MSSAPGPLAEQALKIQADNQRFQSELTAASLLANTNPTDALAAFDRALKEADALEAAELGFLAGLGDWGKQQAAVSKSSWQDNRLQIQVGRVQVLTLLAQFDEADAAIEEARVLISNPSEHPASAMLDELEIAILQARS